MRRPEKLQRLNQSSRHRDRGVHEVKAFRMFINNLIARRCDSLKAVLAPTRKPHYRVVCKVRYRDNNDHRVHFSHQSAQ